MTFQKRAAWMMASLAVVAAIAALGVGFNGYRNTPPVPEGHEASLLEEEEHDPLAPRLFDQRQSVRIHVVGAVRKPGVYTLPSWARVQDALKKAGGATLDADLEAINLADTIRDGEQIRIPRRGDVSREHPPTPEPPTPGPTVGGRGLGRYPFAAPSGGVAGGLVPLNTAAREQLMALPGVGPELADRIIDHRNRFGSFTQPEDLLKVKGIGATRFEQLRSRVTAP